MTVFEASGHLYEWFSQNDCFCMESDFIKVITITETPNEDKVAFLCALKSFEDSEMVSSEFDPDSHKKYWVLKKSFLMYNQQVDLLPDTALAISRVINHFCEEMNNEVDRCDATNITEKDIKNLLYISELIANNQKDLDSGQELK